MRKKYSQKALSGLIVAALVCLPTFGFAEEVSVGSSGYAEVTYDGGSSDTVGENDDNGSLINALGDSEADSRTHVEILDNESTNPSSENISISDSDGVTAREFADSWANSALFDGVKIDREDVWHPETFTADLRGDVPSGYWHHEFFHDEWSVSDEGIWQEDIIPFSLSFDERSETTPEVVDWRNTMTQGGGVATYWGIGRNMWRGKTTVQNFTWGEEGNQCAYDLVGDFGPFGSEHNDEDRTNIISYVEVDGNERNIIGTMDKFNDLDIHYAGRGTVGMDGQDMRYVVTATSQDVSYLFAYTARDDDIQGDVIREKDGERKSQGFTYYGRSGINIVDGLVRFTNDDAWESGAIDSQNMSSSGASVGHLGTSTSYGGQNYSDVRSLSSRIGQVVSDYQNSDGTGLSVSDSWQQRKKIFHETDSIFDDVWENG